MKKLISVAILLVMIVALSATMVSAATSETLPNELYAIGSKYGMTQNDKVKMEQYLRDYPLSNDKCDEILGLAKQAEQIMIENNTTDVHSLPSDVKAKLRGLAEQAATIAGVTLDFKSDRIDVYKDGKWINSFGSNNLAPTGTQVNMALVVSSVAVIALAATAITIAVKKRD